MTIGTRMRGWASRTAPGLPFLVLLRRAVESEGGQPPDRTPRVPRTAPNTASFSCQVWTIPDTFTSPSVARRAMRPASRSAWRSSAFSTALRASSTLTCSLELDLNPIDHAFDARKPLDRALRIGPLGPIGHSPVESHAAVRDRCLHFLVGNQRVPFEDVPHRLRELRVGLPGASGELHHEVVRHVKDAGHPMRGLLRSPDIVPAVDRPGEGHDPFGHLDTQLGVGHARVPVQLSLHVLLNFGVASSSRSYIFLSSTSVRPVDAQIPRAFYVLIRVAWTSATISI